MEVKEFAEDSTWKVQWHGRGSNPQPYGYEPKPLTTVPSVPPKKVLVKKDVIYIRIVHEQDLISRAKPGRSASPIYTAISYIRYLLQAECTVLCIEFENFSAAN